MRRRLAFFTSNPHHFRNYSIFSNGRTPTTFFDNLQNDVVHPLLKELSLILGTKDVTTQDNETQRDTQTNDAINYVRRNFDLRYKPRAVEKITEIVKLGDDDSLEERLQGFQIENDVAEKVLQRLVDSPRSAFRFFDWTKRNGLRGSRTALLKTIICSAGEGSDAELLDRVGDELGDDLENWKLLILQFGKMKMPDKAVASFEKMKGCGCDGDEEAYRMTMRLLCENERDEMAFVFFMEMIQKQMVLDLNSSILLLRCLASFGEIRKLLLVSNKTIAFHNLPESLVYGAVLSCLSEAGRFRELVESLVDSNRVCFRVFEELTSPRVESCNVIVKETDTVASDSDVEEVGRILSSSGEWFEIEESLNQAGVCVTSDLVVELMMENAKRGRIALSFFFWVAERRRFKHTSETYNMAMKIAGAGKDFVTMRKLFHEMRRKECAISADTWAIMIMRYGRTGMTEIALNVFAEMKRKGYTPSYSVFKCLITCLCEKKGRKIKRAIKLFGVMIREGHKPEKKLIEKYLNSLCESGEFTFARLCVEDLCKSGFNKTACESWYIRALCRAGRVEEAVKIVDENEDEETKVDLEKNTMASMVHGFLRKGKVEAALERIKVMKGKGIRATKHVYTSLIGYFLKMREMKKAREILGRMKREGCGLSLVTCCTLIRGYMETGRKVDAWKVLRMVKPNFEAYSVMIACLCRSGGSEEAYGLLLEMERDGIVPSCVNFRNVLFGLNREGKCDFAEALVARKLALKQERRLLT